MSYAGEFFALVTAVCWSFTAIFFSEAGRRIGSFRVNSIRLLFAVAIYAIVLLVITGRIFPENLHRDQVLILALSGLIGLVIGDGCGFKALVMIGPRLTTLLWGTAPIMAVVIAWPVIPPILTLIRTIPRLHMIFCSVLLINLTPNPVTIVISAAVQRLPTRFSPIPGTVQKESMPCIAAVVSSVMTRPGQPIPAVPVSRTSS